MKKLIVLSLVVLSLSCQTGKEESVEQIWKSHQPFLQTLPAGKENLYTASVDSLGTLSLDLWQVKAEPRLKTVVIDGKQYRVPSDTLMIVPVKHLKSWSINPENYK